MPDDEKVEQTPQDVGTPATPPPEYVPKAEFDKIKEELTTLRLKLDIWGQPQPAPPMQPVQPTPSGPSIPDQIRSIDKQLEDLDVKLEDASVQGRGVAAVIRQREALLDKRAELKSDLKYGKQIEELRLAGVTAIDELSAEVTKGKMPHLDIPEVKRDFDSALAQMPPDQRMNSKARIAIYNYAVGAHIDKIVERDAQRRARAADTPPATPAPGQPGRAQGAQNAPRGGIPRPEDILSKDNIDAIRASGRTVESYYQRLGYKGWGDYWEKVGKDYFEEEGNE